MAGHNKWTQIKRQKGSEDAKRSKLFSILSRAITLEAKKALGNPDAPGLRTTIEKARKVNMPNDNIDRAVKRASEAGMNETEELTLESYGPGGVAVMIECLTDSRNRTVGEIRHLLQGYSCALASPGAAAWAFEKNLDGWQPKTKIELSKEDTERLEEITAELEEHGDVRGVWTNRISESLS